MSMSTKLQGREAEIFLRLNHEVRIMQTYSMDQALTGNVCCYV